jgi:hypothetical protein
MVRIEAKNGIAVTQTKGCRFCLHIGGRVWYFGEKGPGGYGARLELMTPFHWFRYSSGGYERP